MNYVKLGATGLDVSPICLGCMTFGEPERGYPSWTMPEDESRVVIRHAIEAGINFFDTSNMYSLGSSEEILGRAIRDFADRDDVVIATKVFGTMRAGRPNGGGLSRKAIFAEIDASLMRLGCDYIDLYQIHRLDHTVPMEESLEALHDVVKAGKARYIGASSMYAWEFAKALHLQSVHRWTRFVSMQDHYNLLSREEEREMLPLCADERVGVIAWSPLARGRLTRDWDAKSGRSSGDQFAERLYAYDAGDRAVVEVVAKIAAERGVARSEVALAWLHRNPLVTAPIVGARTATHVDEAIASLQLELTEDEVTRLEEPYLPHPVAQGIE